MADDPEVTSTEPGINDTSSQTPAPTVAGEDLTTAREWLIKANPDVVPELVAGGSISALQASVEPARAAYQRIAAATQSSAASGSGSDPASTPAATPPTVPAGAVPTVVDVDSLPTAELLRRGVEQRHRGRNQASGAG